MKLNQINLTSVDVVGDRAMFETYFGLHCAVMRGKALAVLRDDQGMIFVLNDFAKKRGAFAYPDDYDIHHIGFIPVNRSMRCMPDCAPTAGMSRSRVIITAHGRSTSRPNAATSSKLRRKRRLAIAL